jgi:cytochrome d ubiquinol oxidase subunit II
MPVVGLLFLIGVILVLTGLVKAFLRLSVNSLYFSGAGTILVVVSLFCLAGLNNTAYYPSLVNMQQSLTIANSSSSKYTLTVMSYVSLLVPFVLAYIYIAWKSINKEKVSEKELSSESHTY